jgi:hypothetical protein
VALVAFALFTLSSDAHVLTPQIAFVSLSVFSQLRAPLFLIADLIGQTVQLIVSNKRLKSFLVAGEIDESAVLHDNSTACKFIALLNNYFLSQECNRHRVGHVYLG